MAPGTYAITTSKTDLNGLWRKAQGKLRIAANFMFEEWDDLQEFSNFDVDWSTREITAPFDLLEGGGVASIDEGGYEARPSSPATVDASFTWVHLNKRFTVSKISKLIQQNNPGAMLVNQMKFQGRKALEAIGQWIADSFYGFSTGVRAKVTSLANNTTTVITVTIKDAYGIAGLGSPGGTMTSPYFAGTLFRLGEWVAFIRAGALVANSIGQITTGPDLTVPSFIATFAVAPTLAADDQIVFANSLENTTLVGTDYNKSITGLLDAVTSVSLQGISSATYGKWLPGYTDTAAGQFTNIKLRRFKQGIQNQGGGKLTDIRWSQGVENSVFSQLQAGMRFTDSYNMEMDGDPKAKGVSIKESRHVPPGYVFGWDRKSLNKMVLLPKPGAPSWDDGEKIPDRSAYVFPIDYPCQMVYLNRANIAYASNKTELL
jgi:hypothetical protein